MAIRKYTLSEIESAFYNYETDGECGAALPHVQSVVMERWREFVGLLKARAAKTKKRSASAKTNTRVVKR